MEPGMCAKGCGFFGTAKNRNMCSQCFADFLKSQRAVDTRAVPDKHRDQIPPPTKNDDVSGLTTMMNGLAVRDSEKKRCDECKKKAGVTGFKCRCGWLLCGKHRLPEQHKCSFDFKPQSRKDFHLPLIKADKLHDRI